MSASGLDVFESMLKSNVIDLSTLAKSDPIKTREEIRSEWLEKRRGKFTASEFYRLMTSINKQGLPPGAETYVLEKVAESLCQPSEADGFINYEMQWGMDNEPSAVQAFMEKTGLTVDNHGHEQLFIELNEHAGGTPDGLIENISGLEIKCPKSTTHIGYWGIKNGQDLKEKCPNYYWQVQGCMLITERYEWNFVSFDPRLKDPKHQLHIAKIEINYDDITALCERLKLAIQLKNKLIKELS